MESFLISLSKIFEGFVNSPFFLTLKFLLAIYVSVLFADLVMLLILRGFGDVRSTFRGMNLPLVSSKKIRKKWKKIIVRLESGEEQQFKLAIIEGDQIVDKIIGSMGLKGSDMIERLKTLDPEQLEAEEDLERAHKIRNQIIHDPSFRVDKKMAEEILAIYEKFLVENEFMED